jgi:hypothetical protein
MAEKDNENSCLPPEGQNGPAGEQVPPAAERREEEIDDGAPVADMNVEGMPWFVRRRYKDRGARAEAPQLSPEEIKAYRWAAVKSALVVILVYGLVFFAFIAFCYFVWFK